MTTRRSAAGLAAAALLACAARAGATEAAAGGRLLPAAGSASAVVVGRVEDPRRLDRHGYAATLVVERTLAGDAPARGLVAWEELAPSRPPRLVAGDRALVALEPPGGSLWHERLGGAPGLAIAAGGEAFLRAPTPAGIEALAAYLALAPDARDAAAGDRALARLVAQGETPLALGALDLLGPRGTRLAPGAIADLGTALGDAARPPGVRRDVLALAGASQLEALAPRALALAEAPGPLRADAARAAIALGAVDATARQRWETSEDPGLRAAVASSTDLGEAELQRLAVDTAPPVRAAALPTLARVAGARAVATLTAALADPNGEVREAAILALGSLGGDAVPALERVALASSGRTAVAALAALAHAGDEGGRALARLASEHPEETVRGAARLMTGAGSRRD